MAEYLKGFNTNLIEGYRWPEMLASGRPIDPVTLTTFLEEANHFLVTTPGPNLTERQLLAPEWLGWWTDYLKDFGKSGKSKGIITNLDNIDRITKKSSLTGVLFAGGFEGHPGHLWSVKWMEEYCNVQPIILLEQDWYIENKNRKGPFLPLEVRLSMWSYYSKNLVVSVLQKPEEGIDLNKHYKDIFDKTKANYCFTDIDDPLAETKTGRGVRANFTYIPHCEYVSTTERVQKLFEDF